MPRVPNATCSPPRPTSCKDLTAVMKPRVVLFGATGRVGRTLAVELINRNRPVLNIGRNPEQLSKIPGDYRVLDLDTDSSSESFINADDIVINTARARFTKQISNHFRNPNQRYIVVGSTRYLTKYREQTADDVRFAEEFLMDSGLDWVMLHPTMIYGVTGENNVQRIAALIRRFRFLPLPAGGTSLIQPIHIDDVVKCLISAIEQEALSHRAIHIAGPQPIMYVDFVREIAKANRLPLAIIRTPTLLVSAAALITQILPWIPTVTLAEVRRLGEDKDVDIDEMRQLLHVEPRQLRQGLAETFRRISC